MRIIKSFLLFESNDFLYFDSDWEEYDKLDGFHENFGTKYWVKPLSERFSCIIVSREGRNHVRKEYEYLFYLKDKYNELHFMDHLGTNSIIYRNFRIISPNDAYNICERQLDYYTQLNKFPTESEIKESLYLFSDEDVYLNDINYGYSFGNLYSSDNYELVQFHRTFPSGEFICVVMMQENKLVESQIIDLVNSFKMLIEEIKNIDYNIKYCNDDRGLLLFLSLK